MKNLKTETLLIKVSPHQRAMLYEAAAKQGLPFSSWARKSLICSAAALSRPNNESYIGSNISIPIELSFDEWIIYNQAAANERQNIKELLATIIRYSIGVLSR